MLLSSKSLLKLVKRKKQNGRYAIIVSFTRKKDKEKTFKRMEIITNPKNV